MSFINPNRDSLINFIGLRKSIVRAEGHYLFDQNGESYLDFHAQFGAVPFGYNDADLWDAINEFQRQKKPTLIQPLSNPIAEHLAKKLVGHAPGQMGYVTFTNSGAETVEAAIKMAKVFTQRHKFLAVEDGFHGKTDGALQLTYSAQHREPYQQDSSRVDFVDRNNIEHAEILLSSNKYAALFVEIVQGEGGMNPLSNEFLVQLQVLCKRYKTLLVVDEIQTGLGRTGTLFACEPIGLKPDMLLLSKALGGGLIPIGACVIAKRIWTSLYGTTHSSTFASNGLGCHIANAVIDKLLANDGALIANVADKGRHLKSKLEDLVHKYPGAFREVTGNGLMLGIHMQDWGGNYLFNYLTNTGMIVPLVTGYIFNEFKIYTLPTLTKSNVLRIEPPLTISEAEIDRLLIALDAAGEIIHNGHHFHIFKHIVNGNVSQIQQKPTTHLVREEDASSKKLGSFAFFIHPTSLNDIKQVVKASFNHVGEDVLDSFAKRTMEFASQYPAADVAFHIQQIQSLQGGFVEGYLILSLLTPEEMIKLSLREKEQLMDSYIRVAESLCVDVIGLGAFTSIISQGGATVANAKPVVTSGNSFTAMSAYQGMKRACSHHRKNIFDTAMAIVGAYGSVGRLISLKAAKECRQLYLIGNAANPSSEKSLAILAGEAIQCAIGSNNPAIKDAIRHVLSEERLFRIAGGKPLSDEEASQLYYRFLEFWQSRNQTPFIHLTTDLLSITDYVDGVFCATSNVISTIDPSIFRDGTIICDVARPSNVINLIKECDNEIIYFEGGLIKLPENIRLGRENMQGFPQGVSLACFSETVVLAMSQVKRNYSIGNKIPLEDAEWIYKEAISHGFDIYLDVNSWLEQSAEQA